MSQEEQQQPLVTHLIELRNRLLKAVISVLVLFLCLFYFANDLYLILVRPLTDILPESGAVISTGIISPFMVPFKLTLVLSILFAIPYILYQLWAFIAPGLYQHEKKFAVPLLISSIILFYLGIAFAYFVALPFAFAFFTATGPTGIAYMPDITNLLDFILTVFFAFGVAFEIPIATYLLVLIGFTTVDSLVEKRPYIFLGCFVVGMLVTPPDVFSQTILAVPMWLLFEVGVLAARTIKKPKEDDEEEHSDSEAE